MRKCLSTLIVLCIFFNDATAQRNFQATISTSAVNTFGGLAWTYVSGTPALPATPIAGDNYEIIFAPTLTGISIITGVVNIYSAGFPTGGNITFTNNSTSYIAVYVNGSTAVNNMVNNMIITNTAAALGRFSLHIGSNTIVNGNMAINNNANATINTNNKDLTVIGSLTKASILNPVPPLSNQILVSNANIQIAGNMEIKAAGGFRANFGNANGNAVTPSSVATTILGNLILGSGNAGEGICSIGKSITAQSTNQKFNLYGDLVLNLRSQIAEQFTVINFLKTSGNQKIVNNAVDTDPINPLNFETINVGNVGANANATKLIFQGTNKFAYLTYNGTAARTAGVTINSNSILDLPRDYATLQDYSLNTKSTSTVPALNILANGKLRIGGVKTENSNPTDGLPGVLGSNFPKINGIHNLDNGSTVEYYGNATTTIATAAVQTIYNVPNYGKLIANSYKENILQSPALTTGIGRAQKITTAQINIASKFDIDIKTDVNLGGVGAAALGNTIAPVVSNGPITLAASTEPLPYQSANGGAGLYCNANVVSGNGSMVMGDYSYLGLGAAGGINANITTVPNAFNIKGNYKYNGIVAQVTGTNLPTIVNDLTTDNATTVTIGQNQIVNGVNLLAQGVFDIGKTKLTINGIGKINSTGGLMKANACTQIMENGYMTNTTPTAILEMRGNEEDPIFFQNIPQNLTSSWFVDNTVATLINANKKGVTVANTPTNPLNIAYAMEYGKDEAGVDVTGSKIITNGSVTLLSRENGTANFGNATNNLIEGTVSVERYLFAKGAWRLLATPVQIATSPTISQSWRENNSPFTSTGYGTRFGGPGVSVSSPSGILDDYTLRDGLKSYNSAANNFTGVTNANTTPIANLKGYYLFVRGDRANGPVLNTQGITNLRIKGDLRTGDQEFKILAGKYTSIGNPFASRIDFRLTLFTKMVHEQFTIWQPKAQGSYNVGAYFTYVFNGTNYVIVGTNPNYPIIRNYIESGEAFYVKSNEAVSATNTIPGDGPDDGTLVIRESDKSMGSSLQSVAAPTRYPALIVGLFPFSNTASTDPNFNLAGGVMVNFNNSYSFGIDNNDVFGFNYPNNNLKIKNGNSLLMAERRPFFRDLDTIPLNISNMTIGNFRFDIWPDFLSNIQGFGIYLKDSYLNSETPLSLVNMVTYQFDITSNPATSVANRFMILMRKEGGGTSTFSRGAVVQTNNIMASNNMPLTENADSTLVNSNENASLTQLTVPNPEEISALSFNLKNFKNGKYVVKIKNELGQIIKTETINKTNKNTLFNIKLGLKIRGLCTAEIIDELGNKKVMNVN